MHNTLLDSAEKNKTYLINWGSLNMDVIPVYYLNVIFPECDDYTVVI